MTQPVTTFCLITFQKALLIWKVESYITYKYLGLDANHRVDTHACKDSFSCFALPCICYEICLSWQGRELQKFYKNICDFKNYKNRGFGGGVVRPLAFNPWGSEFDPQ